MYKHPYALEKAPNFRLVSQLLGRKSHTVLTKEHVVPTDSEVAKEVSTIGQFAEVSFALYDCEWIWGTFERESGKRERRVDWLTMVGGPLEGYDALRDSEFLKTIHGDVADYQATLTRRFVGPEDRKIDDDNKEVDKLEVEDTVEERQTRVKNRSQQLVFAFSGTATLQQAILDINALHTRFHLLKPSRNNTGQRRKDGERRPIDDKSRNAKVHAGFWRLYRGVRRKALKALSRHLESLENEASPSTSSDSTASKSSIEIVATGHSLGGAMATFFMADLLSLCDYEPCDPETTDELPNDTSLAKLASKLKELDHLNLKLVIFGSPRVGNEGFSRLYGSLVDRFRESRSEDGAYSEYCVRGFNDGIPSLPFYRSNYRHAIPALSNRPSPQQYSHFLYLQHNTLYNIPFATGSEPMDPNSEKAQTSTAFLRKNRECTRFRIQCDSDDQGSNAPNSLSEDTQKLYPRGGHNYYNGRDFERTARRMKWAGGTLGQTNGLLRAHSDMGTGNVRRLIHEQRVKRWEKRGQGQRSGEAEWEKVERGYRKKVEKEGRKLGLSP